MQSSSIKLLHKAILDKLDSWAKYINGEYGPPNKPQRYSIRTETKPLRIIISQGVITKIRDQKRVMARLEHNKNIKNIRDRATEDVVWEFPILTLTFEDQLLTGSNRTRLEYADPEFYKKLFAIVDRAAKHGLNETLQAIDLAMEGLDG